MDLTPEEIQANIERLRSKMGDARTGGKGTQRRKVKVVSKPTVQFFIYVRVATIKSSRTSSRRWVLNNWALMRSTSSEMTTPSSTSPDHKHMLQSKITLSSFRVSQKPKPSRTCFPISSNNWVQSNTSFSKSSSSKLPAPLAQRMSPTSLNQI